MKRLLSVKERKSIKDNAKYFGIRDFQSDGKGNEGSASDKSSDGITNLKVTIHSSKQVLPIETDYGAIFSA